MVYDQPDLIATVIFRHGVVFDSVVKRLLQASHLELEAVHAVLITNPGRPIVLAVRCIGDQLGIDMVGVDLELLRRQYAL